MNFYAAYAAVSTPLLLLNNILVRQRNSVGAINFSIIIVVEKCLVAFKVLQCNFVARCVNNFRKKVSFSLPTVDIQYLIIFVYPFGSFILVVCINS